MKLIKKLMALVCQICPFCIYARKFPSHKFSKMLKKAEENCSFCKAYNEIKSLNK